RNLDHNWQQALQKVSAERRIGVRWQAQISPDQLSLTAISEEGISVSSQMDGPFESAKKPEQAIEQFRDLLQQLGTTSYYATDVKISSPGTTAPAMPFIPNSQLKALRRELIERL